MTAPEKTHDQKMIMVYKGTQRGICAVVQYLIRRNEAFEALPMFSTDGGDGDSDTHAVTWMIRVNSHDASRVAQGIKEFTV